MPTYEYACSSCEKMIEVVQSMRDAPLQECPQCGKPGVKRLIGRGAGIIFKGSGFYETDYKRAGQKAGGESGESGGSGEAGAKTETAKPSTGASESSKSSESGKSATSSSSATAASD